MKRTHCKLREYTTTEYKYYEYIWCCTVKVDLHVHTTNCALNYFIPQVTRGVKYAGDHPSHTRFME